jgi:hypothetical protein
VAIAMPPSAGGCPDRRSQRETPLRPGATAAHRVENVVCAPATATADPPAAQIVFDPVGLSLSGVPAHTGERTDVTMELGYFLSSEEHDPGKLLHQAQLAEQAGIESV